MICYHQAEVLKKVISFCSDKGLGEGEIDQLKLLMTEQSQIESACLQLNSEYKLNKYVRENFGFVPPVQYDLNRNSKHGKYQYIPIFQTLEKLLSHDDVFSYIINDHQSGENNLRDFCDGDLYKNHELFSSDHTALQIIFYFDEFTASNPIGHKVKNFKIGAFYMTLGNIPPKYRSQLYTIQLVALCMSSLLKTHGFKEVLQPLIYDLKLLETEGITITKSDGDHKFYGSLSVVLADNLGAHGIGGFLESFSCLRNCRFCFVTRDNMQTQLYCDDFNLRTEEMHSAQLKNLERDSSLSSVYGVKGDSPLNSLEYFHVTQGLPSDLAHDLFEGVVCYVLTNTVESLVRAGLFTLEDLNDAILNFQFEMTDVSNKPTTVQKTLRNFNIKQTAAQTWCLARFLPLIIGGKINRGNAIWETYLHLRDMLFYVCAPAIDRGQVLFMKEIIEDFHESYRQNYPNDSVKPKFHFTLHYPMETLKFGPLIHLQTLRFEGKHNYFKELVYRTKNKINICQFDMSNGSVTPVCLLKDEYQEFLKEALHESTEVYLANSVSCNGIKYIKGGSLIRSQDGDLFCFNRIHQNNTRTIIPNKARITFKTINPSTYSKYTSYTSEHHTITSHRPLSPLIRTVTPTGLSATSHKRSGKSWPKKYTFPVESIPRSVQQQFDLKQPLPKKEMRMFMDTLYLDITKYDGGLYPSSEMYEEIVDAILGAHPYLLKVDGLPLVSVRAYWKGKLVYKFGNSRKRHDGNLPEVVERKRKKEKEPERKEGGILTWGLENYSPSQSISEDEASINSHKEWMLREWRRSEPDFNILDMKMDLTFPSRRSLILKEATVKEVIQEYPWLQSHRQLLREFVRLGPNVRKEKTERILYFGDDTAEETQLELHVRQGGPYSGQQGLLFKVRGSILFECDTFLELICGLIATIYAFNLVYPKLMQSTKNVFIPRFYKLSLNIEDQIVKRLCGHSFILVGIHL
ncbi:unnamed protein product [Mytilus coruscus]|uniref:Uncharacterized protein n=1 Tax=Mytilus coruscus TaxID=42192 RepID=A0A6J8C0I8_MYTCO|nr:unnamed protein product [Mytilus coruscus]